MSTTHHPQPASASCSVSSARLAEPLAGTGPQATAWLAIEQPGPWGRRALTESHLDPELGRELDRRADAAGVRIALIRRPGRHALADTDTDSDTAAAAAAAAADPDTSADFGAAPDTERATTGLPRRVLLADTTPGRSALRSLTITDPRQLLDLDFAALAAGNWSDGSLLSASTPEPKPVLLVCTNGKRDRCCALLGRALTLDLAELMASAGADGVDIWESDHLGGHRFAPTAAVLPTGYLYGRLDVAGATAAVDAARSGRMASRLCRGRSTWNHRGQAAELALREELQEYAADAVLVVGEQPSGDGTWTVDLTAHAVTYRATVTQRAAEEPRAESCGKAFGNPIELSVLAVQKVG
jgi:hypothetical protein